PSQQYGVPRPIPTYRLPPYTSLPEPRKPLARPADTEPESPPRKRQAVDPLSSGRPNLAPLQTAGSLKRRATQELRSYTELELGTPRTEYGQASPSYSTTPRRSSLYSSATTVPHPPPSAVLSSRSSEISPYPLLPPPPPSLR